MPIYKCKHGHTSTAQGYCAVCFTDTGEEIKLREHTHKIEPDNSRIIEAHKEQKFMAGC